MFQKRKRSFFGARRFSRPVARKRLIWVTHLTNVTETATFVTTVSLLAPGDWEDNTTTGNTAQYAKVLKCNYIIKATGIATQESRQYIVAHDDTLNTFTDPAAVAVYGTTDVVHFGAFVAGSTAAATGANGTLNANYPDFVRQCRVNRRFKQDESLFLAIQPAAAAGNQLTLSIFSRTLVQLG